MNGPYQKIFELELKNLIRNSRITFNYDDLPSRIYRKEINFLTNLRDYIHLNPGTYLKDLIFDNCVFNESVEIGTFTSAGRVKFEACTFNKAIKLNSSNTTYDKQCLFNDDLTIETTDSNLELSNLSVGGILKIEGKIDDLTLININKGINTSDQKIIIDSELNTLLIDEVFSNILELAENKMFRGVLKIQNLTVDELKINAIILESELRIDCSKISKIEVEKLRGSMRKLNISNSIIQNLILVANTLSTTTISQSTISNLDLSDATLSESILNIEKSIILNLKFNHLHNKGQITLRELTIPATGIVSFKSTNLGKADFIYCDFSKAGMEFQNSKITEAFFSETEFPKKVFVDGVINYNQAQLTFGQLASAFQKQGDNIRALEYNSREIEAHYRSIKLFSNYFFRKINLWLNFISNNFGRDWVRSSLFSFIVGLTFFSLLLISTDNYEFDYPSFDIQLMPAYLKFMNPLRFFELENLFTNTFLAGSIKLKSMSYLADFGGRIFVAYGYYQTIQAFRRFGRK